MRFPSTTLLATSVFTAASARFVMYADEWHPTRPANAEDRAGIDHVVLAFAMANATAAFQPKVPISTIRSEYPNAKVMIAVGGWGDDIGFFDMSKSDTSIQKFATDVATMLTNTGADGVDIDWEYPGGNGADYKQVPNDQKTYQIDAYPKVLAAIRTSIGDKLLSIAVPGKKGDMIGFTEETGPKIWPSVDYINVMSYDLMNRRDNITKHHTSVAGSEDTIKNYLAIGAPPEKMNLGFAYYAKYFTTKGDCGSDALGCPIVLAEDPITGKDTLTSGAWTFEKAHMDPVDASSLTSSYDGTCGADKGTKCASGCCSQYGNCGTSTEHCNGACQHAFGTGCTDPDVAGSWQLAAKNGVTDEKEGGQYYFDPQNRLFWTWDTPELITRKFDEIVDKYELGGVMAWSLGEDSHDWSHIRQMAAEMKKRADGGSKPSVRPDHASTAGTAPSAMEASELEHPDSDSDSDSASHDTPISDPFPPPAYEEPPPEAPTEPPPTDRPPYNTVYVDGTPHGPDGPYDFSSSPGSPPDYCITLAEYNPAKDSKYDICHDGPPAYHEPPPAPASHHEPPNSQAPPPHPGPPSSPSPSPSPSPSASPAAPPYDFMPDPGYVNPNYHPGGPQASPAPPAPPGPYTQDRVALPELSGLAYDGSDEEGGGTGRKCRVRRRRRARRV